MNRTYLEEDLELVRRYFPGARTTTLRTPFDLTRRSRMPQLSGDTYHDSGSDLHGGVLWLG